MDHFGIAVTWAVGGSLLALAACGPRSESTDGLSTESPGGFSAIGGASTSGAAGTPGGGTDATGISGMGGTGGHAVLAEYQGTVQVGWLDNGKTFTTTAGASFRGPNQSTDGSCEIRSIGQCQVSTCAATAVAARMPQAGQISVSNGVKLSATLTPNSDGSYPTYSDPGVLLPGLDNITISGSGGEVPAFSSTLVQPLALLVLSPVVDSGGQVTWARDVDQGLTFDRGTSEVQLLVQGGSAPGISIGCAFPSEVGHALIPSAALQALPSDTVLSLFTYRLRQITAGAYAIDLKAFAPAMNPDKTRGIRVHLK
jgi:hypothetical protein